MNAQATEFFIKLLQVRAAGYGPDYPKHHLPMDSGDYVARHHIFCLEQSDGSLEAVSTYLVCDLSRYDYYHLQLPIVSLAKAVNVQPHIQALDTLLDFHRKTNLNFSYAGGFTIKKEYRKDRELSKLMRELCIATVFDDFIRQNMACLMCVGVPRFKTELLWEQGGFNKMTWNGSVLEAMPKATAEGEPILIMCSEKPSQWALECREKYRDLLESRIVIDTKEEGEIAA